MQELQNVTKGKQNESWEVWQSGLRGGKNKHILKYKTNRFTVAQKEMR